MSLQDSGTYLYAREGSAPEVVKRASRSPTQVEAVRPSSGPRIRWVTPSISAAGVSPDYALFLYPDTPIAQHYRTLAETLRGHQRVILTTVGAGHAAQILNIAAAVPGDEELCALVDLGQDVTTLLGVRRFSGVFEQARACFHDPLRPLELLYSAWRFGVLPRVPGAELPQADWLVPLLERLDSRCKTVILAADTVADAQWDYLDQLGAVVVLVATTSELESGALSAAVTALDGRVVLGVLLLEESPSVD